MEVESMKPEELVAFNKYKAEFKTVFDVGARGNTEFINIHPDCDYHLFEPIVAYVEHLREQTKNNDRVTVNHCGLGDVVVKAAKFYHNVQSFQPHPWIPSDHNESDLFDINTVDEYCKEKQIEQIDFLKIDTEGFDYKVLLGAKTMIDTNKVNYIQFEYWDGVRKFYDLLHNKYDMWFVDQSSNQHELNEDMIKHIDESRIPQGLGGDVFCKLKK